MAKEQDITKIIRENTGLSFWTKVGIACRLSLPAMFAQLTAIANEYIDAAMVGSLGANASASIGIMSSSIWLIGGVVFAVINGFSVQVSHSVGADDRMLSEKTFRHGLAACFVFALLTGGVGVLISPHLPLWLGADQTIASDATAYFMITMAAMPLTRTGYYAAASIQATGNMKTPAILESMTCALDVLFNSLLIFPSGTRQLFGHEFFWPGAGLGVAGAALGTAAAEGSIALVLLFIAAFRTDYLKIHFKKKFGFDAEIVKRAAAISAPAAVQQVAISGAMVMTTHIIAPLGTIAIAANSFAVTAESVCYMPGFGLMGTASTLVGQSIGAGRKKQARSFAWVCTGLGMVIMGCLGVVMYFACPAVFRFLTPVAAVQTLGIKVLRLELFAEPFYGASIVAMGALRGAGDTLVPSIMSFVSIWGVRITLSLLLVGRFGLYGVWIAMTAELTFRGVIFLLRLKFGKWLDGYYKRLRG